LGWSGRAVVAERRRTRKAGPFVTRVMSEKSESSHDALHSVPIEVKL
jgi:hypothetical protein